MSSALPTEAERRALVAANYPAFMGFSLTKMRSDLAESLTHFGRLGIFEEYTKHDITHVDGMLKIVDWLVPSQTAREMSPADWLLIVLSAYLHDFGLLVTRNEFDRRDSTTYKEHVKQMTSAVSNSRDLNDYLDKLTEDQRERFFYQEFVRYYHARRVKGWIVGNPEPALGYDEAVVKNIGDILQSLDQTFRVDLGAVCESHHLDDIENTDKYRVDKPYGNSPEETANVQYAAIVLRTSDLLHIAKDRTPTVAYQVISPSNPISQVEWVKQNAVRRVRPQKGIDAEGNVSTSAPMDTIEVFATFSEAEGFFGLTSYLQYASSEISECYKWASASQAKFDVIHHFPWRRIDSSSVEAEGFIATHFKFQIDQRKILELLTGHTLYNNSDVVIRELVQNSIDAVRLMAQSGGNDYTPSVQIHWNSDDKIISVLDNGVGMTQEVIESNFLRVGSSRYQDSKFIKAHPTFSPISRFGIGVLSAFMIGDDIDVYTVSEAEEKARHITLRSVHGQYLIRLLEKSDQTLPPLIRNHGTRIDLRLRDDAVLKDVVEIMEYWIVLPRCHVTVSVNGGLATTIGFESTADALKRVLIDHSLATTNAEGILQSRTQRPVEIRQFDKDGVSLAIAVEWNDWFSQWSMIRVPDSPISSTPVLGNCIEGIRVDTATPGYSDRSFFAMSNAVGRLAPRTNVARTALENTEQYDRYLKTVYQLYVGHINAEVDLMTSQRGLSPTKASGEAGFLAMPLVDVSSRTRLAAKIESLELLLEVLETVRGFAVERDGERNLLSLSDLFKFDSLGIVESSLTRHLEFVLSAIPMNASISSMLRALDISSRAAGPVLFARGLQSVFGKFFARIWNPISIHIDAREKEIVSAWEPVKKNRLWHNNDPLYGSDGTTFIADDLNLRERFNFCVLGSTELELSGAESYSGVSIGGISFLFPNNPLFRLVDSVDEPLSEAKAAALFGLTRFLREGSPFFGRARGVEIEARRYIIDELQEHGYDWSNSEDDLVDILMSWERGVFDVSRWERRQ